MFPILKWTTQSGFEKIQFNSPKAHPHTIPTQQMLSPFGNSASSKLFKSLPKDRTAESFFKMNIKIMSCNKDQM